MPGRRRLRRRRARHGVVDLRRMAARPRGGAVPRVARSWRALGRCAFREVPVELQPLARSAMYLRIPLRLPRVLRAPLLVPPPRPRGAARAPKGAPATTARPEPESTTP